MFQNRTNRDRGERIGKGIDDCIIRRRQGRGQDRRIVQQSRRACIRRHVIGSIDRAVHRLFAGYVAHQRKWSL